jgi:hypothetical protein
VALKELFTDSDVLVRHHAPARLMLSNRIDQGGRIAITETVKRCGNVDRHVMRVYQTRDWRLGAGDENRG